MTHAIEVEIAPELERDDTVVAGIRRISDLFLEVAGGVSDAIEDRADIRWTQSPKDETLVVMSLTVDDETIRATIPKIRVREAAESKTDAWRMLSGTWQDLLTRLIRKSLSRVREGLVSADEG